MTKQYGVIIADPPWSYNNAGITGSARSHYETMTDGEIARLPVEQLAADDSVLLMWATWPKLVVCLRVMDTWGFRYVTGFPWIKIRSWGRSLFGDGIEFDPKWGQGFWVKGCSEPILIARRGKPRFPDLHNPLIGLLSPNAIHSRKPDDLYEYAESLDGPYCELFARRRRAGWSVWGNEIKTELGTWPD